MHAVDPTNTTPIGQSELTISRLGLGTGPASRGLGEDEAARFASTIRYGLSRGVTYVDTAPAYYLGRSEEALGAALRTVEAHRLVVSTKVGRLVRRGGTPGPGQLRDPSSPDLVFDFTGDGIKRSLDESLARTGLSRFDIVYIHDPDLAMDQALTEAYPALATLKEEGTIGAIGVGMTAASPLARFVRETDVDCVLLAGRYTLLDQSGLVELLPLCAERGVSVIVGGVFNGGLLANPSSGEFNYAPAARDVRNKVDNLTALCAKYRVPLKAAAIQFPFGHPAVACILSGTISEDHLSENMDMLRFPIPAELWERMRSAGHVPPDAPLPIAMT
jgi:D-threo-aldose 1-dehydrogenase